MDLKKPLEAPTSNFQLATQRREDAKDRKELLILSLAFFASLRLCVGNFFLPKPSLT
jgi:hypothetical protein